MPGGIGRIAITLEPIASEPPGVCGVKLKIRASTKGELASVNQLGELPTVLLPSRARLTVPGLDRNTNTAPFAPATLCPVITRSKLPCTGGAADDAAKACAMVELAAA